MNINEYYWNADLLGLLEDMTKVFPNDPRCSLNDSYFNSYIDDLKERLDKMFDKEMEENHE